MISSLKVLFLSFPALLLASATTAQTNSVPIPEKRPVKVQSNLSGSASEKEPAHAICISLLRATGTQFTLLEPIKEENKCGISAPVSISKFSTNIELSPPSQLSCETALAAANWVNDVVVPSANKAFPNDRLKTIAQSSTYVCRNRNNQATTKISEHAKGGAIDISRLFFESGKIVEIKPRQRTGKMEEAFQKAIRFGACLHFTTVIGPLSDDFHNDHLHLDIAKRRGGYRLCRFPEIAPSISPATPSSKIVQ